MAKSPLIFISAGDPSGDQNSAPIVRSIYNSFPDVSCEGLGGPAMEREGFISHFEFSRFNRMGYIEVLPELKFFLNAKSVFVEMMRERRPDLLICVDYSGFNTPLMIAAKELKIPVIWYIAPMIWAWKKYKHGPRLAKYASHIATILPFEVEYWREFTQNVSYVGNPLLESREIHKKIPRSPLTGRDSITIAVAPGSRKMEIKRILPTVKRAIDSIVKEFPDKRVTFKVSKAEYLEESLFTDIVKDGVELYYGSLTDLFQEADIALVTSGTSTLQAALTTIPMVVMYKSSFLLFAMVTLLTKQSEFNHIALPSIMSRGEVAKELIQGELTPANLTEEVSKLINDKYYFSKRVDQLNQLQNSFGGYRPSEKLIPIISKLTGIGDGE